MFKKFMGLTNFMYRNRSFVDEFDGSITKSVGQFDGGDFDFLVGLKIVKVERDDDVYDTTYRLTLSDGSVFGIKTNSGCGGCSNGWSELPKLSELILLDHVITNVKVEYDKSDKDKFKIFIYYHDKRFDGEGSDGYGNGCYGGGFWLTLTKIGSELAKEFTE